ncbi:FLYWCH zinc finger domain-containing protein [Phthorimaea operculella]|nr:FLYWCH zinc finger domain-containing protein [Phthorimaea operculella]
MPVLIKTAKKKYALLYKQYTFTKRTNSKKGIVWKCTASKSDGCTASLTTDDNLNVVLMKGAHNQHPLPEVEKTKTKHVYFTTAQ